MQLETRLRQPLLQIGDGRRIVIIEVRPRREDLDGLETVRRDLGQVVPAQPLIVKEVRGNAEPHINRFNRGSGTSYCTSNRPIPVASLI